MNNKLKTYFVGISWFILSLVSSATNDITAKYLGLRLHSFEVTSFRFFFSALILVPFILYYGKQTLKTNRPFIHIARGVLLFFAMTCWIYGLSIAPVIQLLSQFLMNGNLTTVGVEVKIIFLFQKVVALFLAKFL